MNDRRKASTKRIVASFLVVFGVQGIVIVPMAVLISMLGSVDMWPFVLYWLAATLAALLVVAAYALYKAYKEAGH